MFLTFPMLVQFSTCLKRLSANRTVRFPDSMLLRVMRHSYVRVFLFPSSNDAADFEIIMIFLHMSVKVWFGIKASSTYVTCEDMCFDSVF